LYVGGLGPNNYTIIQDAIDNAFDGDTVFVYDDSSPYHGQVKVNKSINLIGENRDTTVIDGNYAFYSISIHHTEYVNISGFTIIHGDFEGIRLFRSISCSITGNIISNNGYYGIYLGLSQFNTIKGNIISNNNLSGIYLYVSKFNTIKGNIISHNPNGIYLSGYTAFVELRKAIFNGSIFNTIINNNFLENGRNAFFQNSFINRWKQNYWNRPRILPKLIFGRYYSHSPFTTPTRIPWRPQIDWRPALKPYTIEV
jgi:parallel beta-helix repeat protein